jgi:transposase InsO family protein
MICTLRKHYADRVLSTHTLKYEEVHRNEYRDLTEARAIIRVFLEKIYNQKRLHSAIGYVPPAEFEANLIAQQKEAAARQLTG